MGLMQEMWRSQLQSNVSGVAGRPVATHQAQAAVAIPMQQPVAVAVPVQAAAVPVQPTAASSVMVTCPPGMKPGQTLQVTGPGGQMMQVPVPPGIRAGAQFMVQMPAAPVVTDDVVVMGTVVDA